MPDNVGYTPGSGSTVAADEIGGVLYQRVKPVIGDDGSAADVSNANPLPVDAAPQSNLYMLLIRIAALLASPLGYDKSLARQRSTAVIESGTVTTVTTVTTCTTVATVSTLSNIAAVGGYTAQQNIYDTSKVAWANTVRNRIT